MRSRTYPTSFTGFCWFLLRTWYLQSHALIPSSHICYCISLNISILLYVLFCPFEALPLLVRSWFRAGEAFLTPPISTPLGNPYYVGMIYIIQINIPLPWGMLRSWVHMTLLFWWPIITTTPQNPVWFPSDTTTECLKRGAVFPESAFIFISNWPTCPQSMPIVGWWCSIPDHRRGIH